MPNNNIHFDISERKVLLRLFDVVSVFCCLYFIGVISEFEYFVLASTKWLSTLVLIVYLMVFATIFELYDLQKASKFLIVVKNTIITSSLTVLVYLLTPFYTPSLPSNRLQIVYFFLAINIALLLWRYAYITLISTPRFYKRILLVANGKDVDAISNSLQKSDPNYKVVGYYDIDQNGTYLVKNKDIAPLSLSEFSKMAEDMTISEIVVSIVNPKGMMMELNNALIRLLEKGISIREYLGVYEELTFRIPVQYLEKDFYRYFPFSRSNQNKLYLLFSRILDILFGVIGLGFCLMLLPFLLIGNLIANPGPLLYYQTRVGRNGKHFKLYKFRSMVTNAEQNGAQFAKIKDGRVTKFGRYLRRSRIDEMPQYINVVKGEMSLIGPRPERPEFVKSLAKNLPFYEVRHLVKPGITGWAQVNARYGSSEEDSLDKLQYDLYYIKHRSLFLDIAIIIKTLSTIVFFRGQ